MLKTKVIVGYRAAQGKTACLERNAGRIIKSSENAFSPDMLWRYCKMWTGGPYEMNSMSKANFYDSCELFIY